MNKNQNCLIRFYDAKIREILTDKIRLNQVGELFTQIEMEKSNRSTGFLIGDHELLVAKYIARNNPNTIRVNRDKVWGLILEIFPENRG